MKTSLLKNIGALTLMSLTGCAQPLAIFQSGDIDVTSGMKAKEKSQTLPVVEAGPARGKRDVKLETIALFDGHAMPTGVTVSKEGRIFLSFPRWGDKVINTAVELKDGRLIPFPDAQTNQFNPNDANEFNPQDHLVSVQSVVVDDANRLWLLDPGSVNLGPVINKAPKLWGYDLKTGKRVKAITFPNDVVLKLTYLNDIRFDLNRGNEGTAYITDSGVGGIIVVDLATGKSWRHLDDHPSVKPSPNLVQTSEGEPFLERKPSKEVAGADFRSDGIALSPDKKTLYYTPLTSRDVYAVPTTILADPKADPKKIASLVSKIASKPSGNDGIICDDQGFIYTTDFEDNSIRKVDPKIGTVTEIVRDERLIWADTLAIHDGYLYVTSNQLARQPIYHFGKDERNPTYVLFRVPLK